MIRSARRPLLVALVAILAAVTSACSLSVDDGQVTLVDGDAQLFCAEDGAMALAAQAVPTATHVPCISELPSGWTVDYSEFDHDGVEVKIESRRAPIDDIVLRFNASCTAGAEAMTDYGDSVVFPDGFVASQDVDGLDTRLVLVGPGGCTELDVELHADEFVDVDDFPTLMWIPRAVIADLIFETTDGRLRLDP